ncbi:MAG: hypothetical protein RB191_02210 [Terriglobia bacterium]|nr:hypothetical protein [Terriglobia bacterium]
MMSMTIDIAHTRAIRLALDAAILRAALDGRSGDKEAAEAALAHVMQAYVNRPLK